MAKDKAAEQPVGKKADSKASKKNSKKQDKNKEPNIFQKLVKYLKDVKAELKRVTWPTKAEIIRSSLIVVGALVFFGVLILAIDSAIVPLLSAYSGLAQ